MTKCTCRRFMVSVLSFIPFWVANGVVASPGETKCLISLPHHGIVIDGKLNDWDLSSPIVISRDTAFTLNGSIKSDTDLKGQVYSNYDNATLFLSVQIQDDNVVGPFSGGEIWKNDAVEFWLDCRLDAVTNTMNDDDYQLVFSYTSGNKPVAQPQMVVFRNNKNAYLYAGTQFAAQKTEKGYLLEIGIPLDALEGLSPKPGTAIGFNVSLCDSDPPSEFSRLLWSGKVEVNPLDFGTLVFGKVENEPLHRLLDTIQYQRNQASAKDTNSAPASAPYQGPPKIIHVGPNNENMERGGKFELTVDLKAEYDNPYDFEDLSLQAEFTTPGGKKILVDGFYYQHYKLYIGTKRGDWIRPIETPVWKIRFTPTEVGRYGYVVTVKDKKGRSAKTPARQFISTESERPGFLRVSKTDPYYLEFDNGKPFFGIGYGAKTWQITSTDIMRYKHYLSQLAYFGGNYLSVDLQTHGESPFDLETLQTGLGRYSLLNSFKFDYVVEAAGKRGIYIIPCLNQTAVAESNFWNDCRFNQKNGGPCRLPKDYFTDPKVLKLTRQRLRYIVARWGYSSHILGWELFNEVNYTDGFQKNRKSVREWHRDMAAYLKKIDPNKHLVSTSFGSSLLVEDPEIWKLPEIDFMATHRYPQVMTGNLRKMLQYKLQYKKPNLGGECGLSASLCGKAQEIDPEGISLHNGIWVSALSHGAGNVLSWWNAEQLDPLDLYDHYRAFANYAEGIPWTTEAFKDIQPRAVRPNQDKQWSDFRMDGDKSWSKPQTGQFRVENGLIWAITRRINPESADPNLLDNSNEELVKEIPGILFGQDNLPFKQDLTFSVNNPHHPTTVEIQLSAVEKGGTTLEFLLNGQAVKSLNLQDRDQKNNPSANEVNETVILPLAVGSNELTIRNQGRGWASLKSIILQKVTREIAVEDVIILGLQGKTTTLLWLQNAQNSWYLRWKDKTPLRTIDNISVSIPDMPEGNYQIEWWDTYKGKIFKKENLSSKERILTLFPPPFIKDIACKIKID